MALPPEVDKYIRDTNEPVQERVRALRCWAEGYRANCLGIDESLCPYGKHTSRDAASWRQGWRQALEDSATASPLLGALPAQLEG